MANGNGLTITVAASATPMPFFDVDVGASLTLDDLELTGGVAQGGPGQAGVGGAILNFGSLTVQSCTIDNCSAIGGVSVPSENMPDGDGRGGAISSGDGTSLVINDSTFADNTATGGADGLSPPGQGLGGAVFEFNVSGTSRVTILDSTFAYNTALQNAGAIYVLTLSGTVNFQMNNTILADSTGGVSDFFASAPGGGTVTTSGTNNLILNNSDPTQHGFAGTNTITGQDAQLGNLTDNGGPTPTIAVRITSPAIGHADPSQSEANDQRGLPRNSLAADGRQPDIGGYENQTYIQSAALGQLIPGGPTGTNPLTVPFAQLATDLANGNFSDAVNALDTITCTAVNEATIANSGVSLNTNLIPLLTEIGRVTIGLGKTVFQPPATVASYIGYFEMMANVVPGVPGIPGGLTGGNTLVQPSAQAVTALVEQNIPAVVTALNSFTSTAVGEAVTAGSGVNVNTNLIPLVTDVAELTKTLGVTPVVVPPAIYNQYIADFESMANAIPGGLAGGNALALPWEQAVIGLVEQNFSGTFAALRSFINTAVCQAGSLGLAPLTSLEAPTLDLENLLLTSFNLQAPVLTVTPSLTSPVYGQSLSFTVVVNPGGAFALGHRPVQRGRHLPPQSRAGRCQRSGGQPRDQHSVGWDARLFGRVRRDEWPGHRREVRKPHRRSPGAVGLPPQPARQRGGDRLGQRRRGPAGRALRRFGLLDRDPGQRQRPGQRRRRRAGRRRRQQERQRGRHQDRHARGHRRSARGAAATGRKGLQRQPA